MLSEINLLPKSKPDLERVRAWRQLRLIVGVALAVYILIVAGLLVFSFFISSSEKDLKAKLVQIEGEVKSLSKVESLQWILKGRTEAAAKVLKSRVDQGELLSKIQNSVPAEIALTEVVLAADKITFAGEAVNSAILGNFLDRLEKTPDWSLVQLKTLTRSLEGPYNFSFEVSQK